MSAQQPGWYPDPLGRADRRWFDGAGWTASVVDREGRQGTDQLPLASPPGAAVSSPAGSVPPAPGVAAGTWAGAAASHGWDDRPGLPAAVAPTSAWAQPAPPAPPARSVPSSPPRVVALVLAGVAAVAFVLSLFVLDWAGSGPYSASFGDLVPDGATANGVLDTVTLWHYQWLGYVLAVAGVALVVVAVVGLLGAPRRGHLVAAIVAAVGVLVSTFAIVRYFRGPGADPQSGAWLLPAAFVVLLAAVAVSARVTDGARHHP